MTIDISILAGLDADTSKVSAIGRVTDLISDKERDLFGVTDKALIALIGADRGKDPDEVHLRNHRFFDQYGWPKTHRVFEVKKAEVVSLDFKPVALVTNHYENRRGKLPVSHNATLTFGTSLSATTQWNVTSKIAIDQKIKYEVGFLGTGGGGETSISFETGYGQGASETRASTITSTNMASFSVDPGQTVKAVLSASKGVLRVKITYRSYLEGDVYYDYAEAYEGHHRWAEPIADVMANGGLPNAIESSEIVEIGFYANAKVIVEDGDAVRPESLVEGEEPVPVQIIELS
jgi:hypothetical protein